MKSMLNNFVTTLNLTRTEKPTISLDQHTEKKLSLESCDVSIIGCHELDEVTYGFWLDLHRSNPELESPNFHPEYTKAVDSVRDDVRIAVIRDDEGELVGIFPFQQSGECSAFPAGNRMNDYHGVMTAPGVEIDPVALLKKLNIKRLTFHAISTNREPFEKYQFEMIPSYSLDMSSGLDTYMDWLCKRSRTIKELPRKNRGLERDFGPVRFEHNCKSLDVLDHVIELKRKKYQRTKIFDILSVDWASNLLRAIHQEEVDGLRSSLSVLWANDTLVAAHFGMVSGDVMQYWFPAFDPEYSKYSPGLQLLVDLIRSNSEAGINKIDFSYGSSRYKETFANSQRDVIFGQVNSNPLMFQLAKQRYQLRIKLKGVPMKKHLKVVLRMLYPGYGNWHYR